jgi:hypothetical protein
MFRTGELRLDHLTKQFILDHLDYQYVVVNSSGEAYRIEEMARRGEVYEQKPMPLNPH